MIPSGHSHAPSQAPLVAPPREYIPTTDRGKHCTCWGDRGLPPEPCTAATCDPTCRACASAGRPFFTREDLRFLEDGSGPTAEGLRRLWAAKDTPKGGPPPRGREPLLVCGRGHPKEPGRDCGECINQRRRARYARRQGATA